MRLPNWQNSMETNCCQPREPLGSMPGLVLLSRLLKLASGEYLENLGKDTGKLVHGVAS
jgi:hypothetical protein